MWTLYVLQHTVTKQLYVGVTNNLQRRLGEHNSNQQTATTRKNGEWILIYAEAYRSKEDAYQRERKLKHHGSGMKKLKERIQRSMLENEK